MEAMETIRTRRSTRKYRAQPVEKEKLEKIVQAGRYAPSGGNSQSCHFTVIARPEERKALAGAVQEAFSQMDYNETTYPSIIRSIKRSRKGTYVFHYDAPVLIIVSNRKGYGNAMADSACALENMMLAANALDLGSCWINQLHWLEENGPIRRKLEQYGIGREEAICGALAVGYADTESGLPEREPLERTGNSVTWIE